MDFLEKLDGRRSVRQYDSNFEISDHDIKNILTKAALAPSAMNFQPWRVFAVKDKALQAKMKELSHGQVQVEDASVVFLIFADTSRYLDSAALQQLMVERGVLTQEEADEKTAGMNAMTSKLSEHDLVVKASVDASLFAMNLMHVVRAFGYESVPMTGTDFDGLKSLLKIDASLHPILMLPVGKATGEGHSPVRFGVDSFTTIIE